MIHFFILFLWNVFCLPSKPKKNAVEKQKQEHNNDNNQRLVRELMRFKCDYGLELFRQIILLQK